MCLFLPFRTNNKKKWNVVKFNWDGQREEGLVKTSTGVTLSGTLKSHWKMLLSTLHLTPEPHSSSCIIHACSEWMKGMLLWASRSRSPQSFFELRRGEEKGLWCSFYIRWQSDGNFFFNERGDKSFDRHYFINAHWPQRGAAAPQHMQNVPQFSRQHMYGCQTLMLMLSY